MRTYPDDFINKIILGDCLEVMKDIPDNSIDLIVTDPPYGIEYSSNGGPRVSKERKQKIAKETMLNGDTFIEINWFIEMYRVLKSGGALYCFCSWNSFSEFENKIMSSKFKIKTPLIWDKGNCGMGDLKGDYGNQTEIIIFAHKDRHILNGGRDRNILSFQRPADAYRLHPTQKPEQLIQYLIEKSSNENEIILDPFLGSGTTTLSCQKTKRNFVGIEISEKYWKIANDRLIGRKLWQ
jgi:site-specific DNA-methyltransferase (adenine-specific)